MVSGVFVHAVEVERVMNFILMTKKEPSSVPPRSAKRIGGAFDLWLQRGLHQLFDDVASEPVPDELLRLIEEDRNSTK